MMENKENKKWSLAHLFAYLSFALSITIMVLWCCNVGGFSVVSLDSFVGVVVALLAIVVTLAIAWQIFNSIEIKTKIEELNALKTRLNAQEEDSKTQVYRLNSLVFASLAENELNTNNYTVAFSYLMTSLETSMALNEPTNIETIFNRMEYAVSRIKTGTLYKDMENIRNSDSEIRGTLCYDMIKKRYEKVYNDFISKVKEA